LYKRAIVHAIGELHDSCLRSNIDAIRRHVQATLEADRPKGLGPNHRHPTSTATATPLPTTTTTPLWNETIFLQTLKKLIQDGDVVEQCTSLHCGLTPEFKRKVSNKAHQLSLTGMSYPMFHHHEQQEEKNLPIKKLEHYKLKICPKKIYDLQQ
jgi:hypothetical protein